MRGQMTARAGALRAAGVNRFGDLTCPACAINLITPAGMLVAPGADYCRACGAAFLVPPRVARVANRRQGQHQERQAWRGGGWSPRLRSVP